MSNETGWPFTRARKLVIENFHRRLVVEFRLYPRVKVIFWLPLFDFQNIEIERNITIKCTGKAMTLNLTIALLTIHIDYHTTLNKTHSRDISFRQPFH